MDRDLKAEALIREGERRERARVVAHLQFEANECSPIIRSLLLSIASNIALGESMPELDDI